MSSRTHPPVNPVVAWLQGGLQALFALLVVFVAAMVIVSPTAATAPVLVLLAVLCVTYLVGLLGHGLPRVRQSRYLPAVWLLVLSLEWMLLVWLTPHAAYLAFPLFFLYLDVLPRAVAPLAVLAATASAIAALVLHNGWSVGGVVGPLVGAGVAVLIGLTYQALRRQSVEYERLYNDLVATQSKLVVSEREAGALAERARLAREIHDTVAQSLSSIALLLNAAERADPQSSSLNSIRLARDAATESLKETRGIIRALTPPLLAEQGLGAALRRLANEQWGRPGLTVDVRVADALDLPMPIQAAFLRIAQGAMANVIEHSGASTATITVTGGEGTARLRIGDNGRGFDVSLAESPTISIARDSFGLRAARERIDQLGGELRLSSGSATGTVLEADVPSEGGVSTS